jgi:hypothetical protein
MRAFAEPPPIDDAPPRRLATAVSAIERRAIAPWPADRRAPCGAVPEAEK